LRIRLQAGKSIVRPAETATELPGISHEELWGNGDEIPVCPGSGNPYKGALS